MNEELPPQKGLRRYRYRNDEEELNDARTSVRRWWFEYLRLSKDYWLVSQTNGDTTDKNFNMLWRKFGDIHNTTFDDWWLKKGRHIFREQTSAPKVELVNGGLVTHRPLSDTSVLIQVPLILRQETVMRQIRKLLASIENVRPKNILATSTSKFPINPVSFRLEVLQKMHEVWCEHRDLIAKPIVLKQFEGNAELNERKRNNLFELGKRLNISPSNALLHNDDDEMKRRRNRMRATVSRYIRRANQLIYNVECGHFPVFKSPPANVPSRFTDKQREAHKELEQQWWALDLRVKI